MKKFFENKINKESLTGIVQKTVDTGKKVATNAKENVSNAVEKAKSALLMKKLKKLSPVFPDQYESDEFNLPNVIMIVDDAVRRGNKLCEGAVGWLSNDAGVEVFCLYDEAIEFSKIQFVPAAVCDAIYYVDNFDRSRFIRTDCIFSKAHEERIAELKHIAFCLGAKKCSIEISESQVDSNAKSFSMFAKEKCSAETSEHKYGKSGKKNDCKAEVQASAEFNSTNRTSDIRSGKVEIEFEGNTVCTQPKLKWFAYDDTIKRLIEMRISGQNAVKCETLELSGSSSATMSRKTACAIDSAIDSAIDGAKYSAVRGGGLSLSSQVEKESMSKLIYHIEY